MPVSYLNAESAYDDTTDKCGLPNGYVCTQDSYCASNHCSNYDKNGVALSSGQYHCCATGFAWNTNFNYCEQAQLCNPPCSYNIGQASWWTTSACLDQTQACCLTDIFGDNDYHYLDNQRI